MQRRLIIAISLTSLLAACGGGGGSGTSSALVPLTQNPANAGSPLAKSAPVVTDHGINDTFRGGITVGADGLVYASGQTGLQQFTQDLSLVQPTSLSALDASLPDTWPVSPKGLSPTGAVTSSGSTVSALGSLSTTGTSSLHVSCGCVTRPALAQYDVVRKIWFNVMLGNPGDVWVSLASVPNSGGVFIVADTPTSSGFTGLIIPVGPQCGGNTPLSLPLGASTLGPDGLLWIAVDYSIGTKNPPATVTPKIVVVDPNRHAEVNEFALPAGSHVTALTSGTNAVWFTDEGLNAIGRIVLGSTAPTMYPIKSGAGRAPMQITPGTDAAFWFTESNGNQIGRIDATGSISEFKVPTPNSHPRGITGCGHGSCPAGKLFFTEDKAVGKVTY